MSLLTYLPLSGQEPIDELVESETPNLPIKARAIRTTNVFRYLFGNNNKSIRDGFEESPYDFTRIAKAIDTDSYVKQAFGKYSDLFWKEGWTLTGENIEALDYVWSRIDFMEKTMNQSFEAFLGEVVDQLLKFSNVFIAKARLDVQPYVRGKRPLPDEEASSMVAGFYIIPTETVRVKRDQFNRPKSYAQFLDGKALGKDTKSGEITWPAKDVIHLYLDRKPGRAFGTPFVEATLDDVVSLRQVEEDILNLVHRELFPLYVYHVGNDNIPAKEGELDEAVTAIEMLKSEGGLVAPGHHSVEVIGAQGNSLEVEPYLTHFKERVAIGLGVSPHHLGMMGTSSNRSVTERLDLALYDKIKNFQAYIENALRIYVFNPMLEEGGFSPTGNISNNHSSDACYFEFREIDIDTQIKKENHYVDLFLKSAITWEELRDKIAMPKEVDTENLFMIMNAKIQAAMMAANSAPDPSGSNPDSQKSVGKGNVNLPNVSKSTSNKDRPINQFGRNQSPNIKNHLDHTDSFIENVRELLEDEENEHLSED